MKRTIMTKKYLIVGNGFLGSNLIKKFKETEIEIVSTCYSQRNKESIKLDVRNDYSIDKLISKTKPDCIINCSAITNVDYVEKNAKIAYSINSEGVKNLAIVSAKNKIKFIQISTDSIFDGRKGMYNEKDTPNPINTYGKSKLLAEKYVQDILNDHLIIRTNFYGYHENDKFLFNWIFKKLQSGEKITGFCDIVFNPLEIQNLCDMILEISQTDHHGIFHISGTEVLSKLEFAEKIADVFEFEKKLINRDTVDNFKGFFAKRPKNTSLDNKKFKRITNIAELSFHDWLVNIKKQMN